MNIRNEPTTSIGTRHGAPLLPPVLAYAVLTVAAAVIPLTLAGSGAWTSDAALLDVYRNHHDAVRWQALLTTATAVPLVVLTAIFSDRIRRFGLVVPGRVIALAGGVVAGTLLAIAGLLSLALSGSHAAESLPLLQFGQNLAVALGGTGFALFSGLLVAGIAVTGLMGGLLPRPLAVAGLVIALLAELAVLTTVTSSLSVLLPIARFGGLIWLVAAAFTLHAPQSDEPRAAAQFS